MAWLAHYDADLRAGFLDKVPSRERVNKAFIARYFLTEDEQSLLRDVLRGDVIYCPTVANSHPMLRTFHSYAEWIVDHTMKPWGRFLDIGGNPRLASDRRHVVVLANNARDQLRLARTPGAASAFANGHLCLQGAANCEHGPFSTRAVAVHSAYDITPTDWFLIMSRNRINLVDVFMWDPDELHGGVTLPSTDAFGFRLDMDEDEDTALFLPLDGSPGYKHSLENWRWYREGHATCGPYQLVTFCEHVWGPFRQYSLVLTLLPVTRVFFKSPLNRDWVHVPVLGKDKYVAVPTQKWRAALNWGFSRIDTNFSRSNLAAYLRAISARVVIGSREYTSAWNPDEWTFAEVVTTAFVMCAVLRSYGSTTIGAAMKELSYELKNDPPGWWKRSWRWVKSWFTEVEDFSIPDWDPEPSTLLALVADHIIGDLSIMEEGPKSPPCLTMDVPPPTPPEKPQNDRPDFRRYRPQAIDGAPTPQLRDSIAKLDAATGGARHTVVLVEGPPGSGKSSGIRNRLGPEQARVLVITPVGKLAEAWREKGFSNVVTHHKAASLLPGNWKWIVVDEAFMMHPGLLDMYAACAPLILLGDCRQIGFIDWERNTPDYGAAQLREWADQRESCNLSYRVPEDAATLVSSFSEPFGSASPVKNSLFLINRPDEFPGIHAGTTHLCFTQAVKKRIQDRVKELKLEGQNVMTVHEAQGLQFKHVALHLDVSERMFIVSHPEHMAVGLSRHTESLVITEHGYTLTDAIQALRTPLGEVEVIPQEFVPRTTVSFTEALEKVDLKTIQESGGQAGDLGVERPVASVHTAAAENLVKPVQISLAVEPDTVMAHVPANSPFMVMPTKSTDHAQAQAAVVQRPATVAPTKATGVDAERARTHVTRFLTMACNEVPQVDFADLQESLAEALRKIHDKNGSFVRYLQDDDGEFLDEWIKRKVPRDEGPAHLALLVNGFLKTQRKFCPELKLKPGQPIQPVNHLINLFFSQVFRAVAAALKGAFKDNVLFVDGHSEKQLSAFVARHYDWRDSYLANDFTAFDSTQGERTMLLEAEVLRRVGIDQNIIDLYREFRLNARYSGPGADIPAAGMRMSGEANTLLGNTLVTGILHCAYVSQEPAWMMFKGDDAILAGPDSMDVDVKSMSKDYGMKAKLERMPVPEFVSFFISPYGLLPDFFRIANKMVANDHQSSPEWREASAANAKAILALADNPAAPAFAMLAAEKKYGITPEQSWAAFTIVCDRANGKFEEATPNLKVKLKVNPDPPISFHRTTLAESRAVQPRHRVDGV
ncbi:non-structural polyprotein [Bastrovirus 7]|uniref:non-structural polyprotein n=1 Tax=Bastrovirus 7 TaxID=1803394 RepID=UPI00076F2B96|nr:non-structural polyprotein [Bastrovirus 7]AMD81617.1 non-structural polyprotein [Bastrovirus 7]